MMNLENIKAWLERLAAVQAEKTYLDEAEMDFFLTDAQGLLASIVAPAPEGHLTTVTDAQVRPSGTSRMSLSKLAGKQILDVHGWITESNGADPTLGISEIVFVDGTKVSIEGEHDFAYVSEYSYDGSKQVFPQDLLDRIYAEANPEEEEEERSITGTLEELIERCNIAEFPSGSLIRTASWSPTPEGESVIAYVVGVGHADYYPAIILARWTGSEDILNDSVYVHIPRLEINHILAEGETHSIKNYTDHALLDERLWSTLASELDNPSVRGKPLQRKKV